MKLGECYCVPPVKTELKDEPLPCVTYAPFSYYYLYGYYNICTDTITLFLQNRDGTYRSDEEIHNTWHHEYCHYLDDQYSLVDLFPSDHNYCFELRIQEMGLWERIIK